MDRPAPAAAPRLLIDPPLDGPTNMAVDACLLAEAEQEALAALRLYRWARPTVSLGYFQRYDDLARRDGSLAALPVVRRVTGGGAILHADELTYSLALPAGHALAGDRPEQLYAWMHARIAEAAALLGGRTEPKGDGAASARGGPFLCFECAARFDLVAGPGREKLAGSAQRRTRAGVLQHGSVVLARTHPVQPSAALDELLGRAVSFDEFAAALASAVRTAGLLLGDPRPSEPAADRLAAEIARFAGEEWTKRR